MSFTWSYSALKDYINCPRKYHEVKVLKRFETKVTQAMTFGTEVHKHCEDYIGEGKPLPKNYQHFKPVLDSLLEIGGTRYPEHEMGLKPDGSPCQFADPDRWVRGIADLLIVDGEQAYIVDYKTGSNKYPDPKQLKLMALMVFAHFPEVQNIKAGLLFIVHTSFVDESYTRSQVEELWGHFRPDLQRLQTSYDTGVWNPNRTPLCGWCPVTSCENYKERR
jgi:CRISPR/Cas system-associated exonuclease Cas4 (RecB family)